MSGHCDFCQVWHSGSCCHPGRAHLESVKANLARVTAERDALRRLADSNGNTGPVIESLLRTREALAAKLARADGLLREAQDYLTEDEPQGSLRDCIDAYFAASEQEPRT